jgi:hypothetical protein
MAGRIIAREETRLIGNETGRYEKKLGLTILGVPTMNDKARLWISREIPFLDFLSLNYPTNFNSHHMFTLAQDGELHLAPLKDDIQVSRDANWYMLGPILSNVCST